MKSLFGSDPVRIIEEYGKVIYYPKFFDAEKSDIYLKKLIEDINWKQEPIWMFGKQVMQPRLTALYGNPQIPYGYSGIEMKTQNWSNLLLEIKHAISLVSEVEFTHVLLNYYRDGKDSMGWHRDNEKVLGLNPEIASVSFGVIRVFQFRRYDAKNIKKSIQLEHGSLLLMKGVTQHHWEHQLPKRSGVNEGRINLTFRKILE